MEDLHEVKLSESRAPSDSKIENPKLQKSSRARSCVMPPKLFLLTPCAYIEYLNRVGNEFGWKFVIMLVSTYVFVKGSFHGFLLGAQLPYYKSLGLDGIKYQTASAVAQAPWAMKGAIGAISDAWPLFGYYKRPYMVFTGLLGTAGVLALATLDSGTAAAYAFLPAILFMLAEMETATADLLCEAKYAEMMRNKPHTGSDIVTFVWMAIMLGKIVSASMVGPLCDHVGTWIIFWICTPLAVQILLPSLLGYLPEKKVPPPNSFRPNWDKILEQKKYFAVSLLMAAGALGQSVVGLVASPLAQFICSITISAILAICSFLWMPRMMAMCNFYMFLTDIFHPFIGGALEYWYTAKQSCVPGGPSFSYTYFTTWSGLVGTFAALIGLFLFQLVVSKWTFREAFWVTTFIRVLASVFDLVIIQRWNIAIGIPDSVLYMLGDAIVLDIVEMLKFMPSVVLISKLCPPSMESTVYAILAGFANFGSIVSKNIGAYAIIVAGVDTSPSVCNYTNLPWLVVVCHLLLPLLTIPLTFFMIPNVRMTGSLLEPEEEPLKRDEGHPLDTQSTMELRCESNDASDFRLESGCSDSNDPFYSSFRTLPPPVSDEKKSGSLDPGDLDMDILPSSPIAKTVDENGRDCEK